MLKKGILLLVFVFVNSLLSNAQITKSYGLDDFLKAYNTSPKKTLLDVRTPEEWAKGKIASSKCINIKDVNFVTEATKLDKNTPIFVFCAAGVRSASANKKLTEAGFKNVINLTSAGYADLAAKGLK
jgi:rhodanese-related sulfurtransferase